VAKGPHGLAISFGSDFMTHSAVRFLSREILAAPINEVLFESRMPGNLVSLTAFFIKRHHPGSRCWK
jgi:hypothetical protein